jgi:putative glutamine amidotransferase
MTHPVIGITLDSEEAGEYSNFPWLALRANYADRVAQAGGLPVMLPQVADRIGDYLDLIDGLMVSGGAFDIDPALFGATDRHPRIRTKDHRTAFEWALAAGALERDLPLLGICGGMQLLHVVMGGTLIQHIPDAIAGALVHEQPNPRDEPGHPVAIVPGTRLHRIVDALELPVNSTHHQAAGDVPAGVVVNARAADGVIEGIEVPDRRCCLGVQWHPEFALSAGDLRLFAGFIDACRP